MILRLRLEEEVEFIYNDKIFRGCIKEIKEDRVVVSPSSSLQLEVEFRNVRNICEHYPEKKR